LEKRLARIRSRLHLRKFEAPARSARTTSLGGIIARRSCRTARAASRRRWRRPGALLAPRAGFPGCFSLRSGRRVKRVGQAQGEWLHRIDAHRQRLARRIAGPAHVEQNQDHQAVRRPRRCKSRPPAMIEHLRLHQLEHISGTRTNGHAPRKHRDGQLHRRNHQVAQGTRLDAAGSDSLGAISRRALPIRNLLGRVDVLQAE